MQILKSWKALRIIINATTNNFHENNNIWMASSLSLGLLSSQWLEHAAWFSAGQANRKSEGCYYLL